MGTSPTRYVSDPEGLSLGEIIVQRDYEDDDDKTEYEARDEPLGPVIMWYCKEA